MGRSTLAGVRSIPFTDFAEQFDELSEEILAAVRGVLESGDLILREPVAKFEASICEFLGARHVIGLSNGTDALRLALIGAGIGPGDDVLTVAHTFVATAAAIVSVGATPVLVDVGPDHNMDLELIPQALTERSRAIIAVHINGRMVDMARLTDLVANRDILIIEDAAQAMGSSLDSRRAGTHGAVGCFSFFPGKVLGAAGDAGAVATDNDDLAERIRLLRDHGRVSRTEIAFWGENCRIDAIQAAILSVKLPYVPRWIERRRGIATLYDQVLRGIGDLVLPPPPSDSGRYFDVFQSYVIESERRDDLALFLRSCGIEALAYWPVPMHKQRALGLAGVTLPRTEEISRRVLSLPMYGTLDLGAAEAVAQAVVAFFSQRATTV